MTATKTRVRNLRKGDSIDTSDPLLGRANEYGDLSSAVVKSVEYGSVTKQHAVNYTATYADGEVWDHGFADCLSGDAWVEVTS